MKTDITTGLCDDEVVRYLADRYHTTPDRVLQRFLVHDGIAVQQHEGAANFQLEENEMEILRGLTRGSSL